MSLNDNVQCLKLTEVQPHEPLSQTTGGSRIFGIKMRKTAPKFTFFNGISANFM